MSITVGEFIDRLSKFPNEWEVHVVTPAGGPLAIEHRESKGKPFIGIYGSNGGRIGENPLTEEEYQEKSKDFLRGLNSNQCYTSIHGDHRLYWPDLGSQAICYGQHYDRRIVERMVAEGLIPAESVDIDRVKYLDR